MTGIYTLKFYRVHFDDTAEKNVPQIGEDLAALKEQACEALTARFEDDAAARRKRSRVPHTAVILDKHEHVIARFQVELNRKTVEIPSYLWLDRWPGTPAPEFRRKDEE